MVNDLAWMTHEKMLEEQASQTQQQGFNSLSLVNDAEILSKVLGECRGHNRGRGRKLKSVVFSSMFQESHHAAQRRNDDDIRSMNVRFVGLAAHTNASMVTLLEAMRRNNPNVTFPDILDYDISLASLSSSLLLENTNGGDNEDLGYD